jgi:glutamate dehydrogenase (NAD(P)+)/glutamate dehydrogenase (NADP+)
MLEWTKITDELGPEKIVHVYDPMTGMKGVVVIDTTSMGGAAGGTRMLTDITSEEIFWLARAMTYKFAILDMPIGGAKAGLWAEPSITGTPREAIMRAFGNGVKSLIAEGLTLGPDMGTDAKDIATIYEGAGVPSRYSGLALQEKDGEPLEDHATGYGVVVAAKTACEFAGIDLRAATVAIEGFGKVGGGVARYMTEAGAKVVAISTIHGTTYNKEGLDIKKLLIARRKSGDKAVQEYKDAQHIDKGAIYFLPVDILVPGARPYVIDKDNANQVQAKIISSIANIPITDEAEESLFERGIYSVPDFISNAGGVVLGIVDVLGGTVDDVFKALRELLGPLTHEILADARKKGVNPRTLAVERTRERVLKTRTGKEAIPPIEELLKIARQRLKI